MAGLGCDIAQISRFGGLVRRWGSRFLERAYSQQEINQYYSICANCEHRGVVFLASRQEIATCFFFFLPILVVQFSPFLSLPEFKQMGSQRSNH